MADTVDRARSHLEWKLTSEYAPEEVGHVTYNQDHNEHLSINGGVGHTE